MAYNPQMYYPQAYQAPQFQYQPQMPQQMMTPPTIRAEIVQVDNEEAASSYPVGAGASQMMIAKDDSAIYVKTAGANGTTLDVYVKRPPAPPAPVFDPTRYVTREELEQRLNELASRNKKEEKA